MMSKESYKIQREFVSRVLEFAENADISEYDLINSLFNTLYQVTLTTLDRHPKDRYDIIDRLQHGIDKIMTNVRTMHRMR